MTLDEIKSVAASPEYDFVRLIDQKNKIILLGLGGSHAYGTDIETSDLDIRGCMLNTKEEILTCSAVEQVVDSDTDTTIYGFNKLLKLLMGCNPNIIEMLGLKPEHYLTLTEEGKELIDNRHLFLSKRAYYTFGGYAYAQLRRLDNKAKRKLSQPEQEKHLLNSLENFRLLIPEKYGIDEEQLSLSIGKSSKEELEEEVLMNLSLENYPLRSYIGMLNELNNIVRNYSKLGARNEKAIKRGKLAKHMMHLIRLYMMCHDILINEEIITYREKEHALLMSIRNGRYLTDNDQPTREFMEMVEYYQNLMEQDKEKSELPDRIDVKKVRKLMERINEKVVIENL